MGVEKLKPLGMEGEIASAQILLQGEHLATREVSKFITQGP